MKTIYRESEKDEKERNDKGFPKKKKKNNH